MTSFQWRHQNYVTEKRTHFALFPQLKFLATPMVTNNTKIDV